MSTQPETESSANGQADGGTAAAVPPPQPETSVAKDAEQESPCTDCLPRSPKDDHAFTRCGCNACDTESVEMHCQSEGDKARAKYADEHKDAPAPQSYESARLAYGQARYTVIPIVEDLRDHLNDAKHEIRCHVDDRDTIDRD